VLNAAGTAASLIKTGSSVWGDLKDALHIKPAVAPMQADVTADQSGGGIWAGTRYLEA